VVSALHASGKTGGRRVDAEGAAGGHLVAAPLAVSENQRAEVLKTPYARQSGVRRLTPTECERLMSWPDGWTLADEKTPDSRRYAACGDGVVSNVAEWIGRRMLAVDSDNQ
jgi:site-specific DNA-cytosine methylase